MTSPWNVSIEKLMPTIPELRVNLTAADICRSGVLARNGPASPSMLARSARILELVDMENWFEPAVSYGLRPVVSQGAGFVEIPGAIRIRSQLLSHRLRRATHVAIGVCTLGARITAEIRKRFAAKQPAQAMIIDELGTLALYRLGEIFEKLMQGKAAQMGLQISGPLNPGEDGFDLGEQSTVLQIAGAADIGVSLTGGAMLSPEKSLTTMVGMGKRMLRWTRAETCTHCRARERCAFRQAATERASA